MAERGAVPQVSRTRQRALGAMRAFFTPLLPDDYLELINPLWSTQELRGRIERIQRETDTAVTVWIRPGYEWPGHKAGQYVRIGVVVNGVHHWRAYSLTSDPGHPQGLISVTPKRVDEGVVSPFLTQVARPGDIVRLGGVEGDFTLPERTPEKLLFISAGSGVTPIMGMLAALENSGDVQDVVHLHSAHSEDDVIFGSRLKKFDERNPGYKLHLQITGDSGRMEPAHLDELCPDWAEREAFVSGPGEMLDALDEHWESKGATDKLRMERFQPKLDRVEPGAGGTITFAKSGKEAESDGSKPILVAGEDEGLELPFGCREGICHTCIGKLCSGQIRDLRNGRVYGSEGEMVRTCINAPEGPIEIAL
ncbi:MAG: stearoyl-CoA 9-desaturase oxidoreductase [Thermoleophilaceae bacterium]|jgi:ferredoxin-NADP reductase|nr:stearoyl-CoA 9-desaturase oxidoreductase [Thermoleophilaceae bacterium]